MEGIVFWLVPVVLLVVLILLVMSHEAQKRKKLLFVEPIGTLVKGWQLVRIDGQVHLAERGLYWLGRAAIDENWLGDLLKDIMPVSLKRPKELVQFVSADSLGPLSWQIIISVGGKKISFLLGLSRSLEQLLDVPSDTALQKLELHAKQELAGKHGYLQLLLAEAPLGAKSKKMVKHHLLAALVLEPRLDEKELEELRAVTTTGVKFLSQAPQQLLETLFEKVFRKKLNLSVVAHQLEHFDSPQMAEQELIRSDAIAEAPLKARHAAIRAHQHHFDCDYRSSRSEDKGLVTKAHT